jgi:hypothetical protein
MTTIASAQAKQSDVPIARQSTDTCFKTMAIRRSGMVSAVNQAIGKRREPWSPAQAGKTYHLIRRLS